MIWGIALIKKLLILLLFLTGTAVAKDMAEIYLSGDEESLYKILNDRLASKEYWEEKLNGGDYKFGYYQKEKDILVACKECDRLRHLKVKAGKQLNLKDLNATFGKVSGDKKREGDLKTPIGVYTFVEKLDKSKNLHPFYGPVAFVTDYPNLFDKKLHKNGSGIWLHGFPIEGERDPKTKGCIALENDCLETIAHDIKLQSTLVLINESKENLAKKDEIISVLVSLFKWRKYWVENDFENYISFYDEDFKRADGLRLKNFTKLKREIFSKNRYISLFFTDLQVTPYPNSIGKTIYKIKFYETYRSNLTTFKGHKELYIELGEDSEFKIILES